jgi:tRNA (mo5U34)-methyltransferase
MPFDAANTTMPANLPGWPLDLAFARFSHTHHGDYVKWAEALDKLPSIKGAKLDYGDTVTVRGEIDNLALGAALQDLHPWRKGPFRIGDVVIDTEWRSDWKWSRLSHALGDLAGERILDIGCGNGYFGWRMLAQGAAEVVGIDPTLLFCMQHRAIAHYCDDPRNWVLPLKVEEIPATITFDTTLSMGVIYHRRDPQEHVQQIADLTTAGGRGVLESIIVSGDTTLVPEGRYARMRNVWCVPRVEDMCDWMHQAGFVDVEVIDISPTTIAEQRSTHWMRFESLTDTLDTEDPSKTVEGHPAPIRAVVIGHKP